MEIQSNKMGRVRPVPEGEHNAEQEYRMLSIVYSKDTNKSYISKKDVPAGINIDNKIYWQVFGNGKFVDNAIINVSYLEDSIIPHTLAEAISMVDEEDRRPGIVLAFFEKESNYNEGNAWILYQFKGSSIDDWDKQQYWTSVYNRENKFKGWFLNSTELVERWPNPFKGDYAYVGQSLNNSWIWRCNDDGTWSRTSERFTNNAIINYYGDITNNPDFEDIDVDEQNRLKFADRESNENEMGYVILRKDKTFAEQVTKENTIYEIRYNFVIDENISIPENCILKFEGGSIDGNKFLIGNNSIIIGLTDIRLLSKLNGTFNSVKVDIQKDIIITEPISIQISNVDINLNGHTITGYRASTDIDVQLLMFDINAVSNINIYNGVIDGGLTQDLGSHKDAESNAIWIKNSTNIKFENIHLNNTGGCYLVDSPAKNYCSFRVDNTDNIIFKNFTIYKALTEGIVFWDSNNITIEKFNEIKANGTFSWTSLHFNACQYVNIKDCVLDKNAASGSCIILGAKHAIVENVISDGGHGIDLTPHPYTTFSEEDIIIRNCKIRANEFGIMRQWPNEPVSGTLRNVSIINNQITIFHLAGNTHDMAIRLDDVNTIHAEGNIIDFEDTPDYAINPDYIPTAFDITRGFSNLIIKDNQITAVKGIEFYGADGHESDINENIQVINNTFNGLGMNYPSSIIDENNILSNQSFIRAITAFNFKNLNIKGNILNTIYYGIYIPVVFVNSWNINIESNIIGVPNGEMIGKPIVISCLGDQGINYVYFVNNKIIRPGNYLQFLRINSLMILNNYFDLSNEIDSVIIASPNIYVGNTKDTLIIAGNITNKRNYSYSFINIGTFTGTYKYINAGWGIDGENNYSGPTTERPTLLNVDAGQEYYDTDLKKKILWDGNTWINVDGSALN